MDAWSAVWMIAAALLLAVEWASPGRSAGALGAGAAITGLGRWAGLWAGAVETLTAWFVTSLLLVLALRALRRERS